MTIDNLFGDAAIAAATPVVGERVLDIGYGAGVTSFDIAARVGAGGPCAGRKISSQLVGRAQERAAASRSAGTAVTFRLPFVRR